MGEEDGGGGLHSAECYQHDPVPLLRMVLIFFLASPLAAIGLIGNTLLLRFFSAPQHRGSPTLYLAVMAALDATICAFYVLIFGGDAAGLFWELGWLTLAVTYATLPLLVLSRAIQLAATYIVIAAATDRFLLIYQGRRPCLLKVPPLLPLRPIPTLCTPCSSHCRRRRR